MYIKRKIHYEIEQHLLRKEYTIITGARQSGKTSLLLALYKELADTTDNMAFLSLEDREVLAAINEHPENIFRFAQRPQKTALSKGSAGKTVYLFIDEIQYADDPANLLKYLYDKYDLNLKVVATGSSAFYIDSKFKDSLAGRKRIYNLRTLDFDEVISFKDQPDLLNELSLVRNQQGYISARRRELIEAFNEYLIYGGYPAVVLETDADEKIKLLKDIRDSFLKRDIDESGINNTDKFYRFIELIGEQTGGLVNKNELANTLGIDNKTIGKYLHVLEKCFHIYLVKPFYSNLRKEITKMPKIYFNDHGLRNVSLNRFHSFEKREDRGQLIENYVFRRLVELYGYEVIRFWRTVDQQEIDFIISTSQNEGTALDVKMNCRSGKQYPLRKFKENYSEYSIDTVSYDIDKRCRWILKL